MRMRTSMLVASVVAALVSAACAGNGDLTAHHDHHDSDSSHAVPVNYSEVKLVQLLDSFEEGTDVWMPNGAGDMKVTIEPSDDAKVGKKSAKITFSGERTEGSWVDLSCPIQQWKKEINQVSFWAKADKACTVKVKMSESGWPDLEIYSKKLSITTEWTLYTIPLADFKELDWGMEKGNKTYEPEKTTSFGFRPLDVNATIFIDEVRLEQKVEGGAGDDHKQGDAHGHGKKAARKPPVQKEPVAIDESKFPYVVDDFEGTHLRKWRKLDSGSMKSTIDFTDEAAVGKKAATITFTGTRGEGSWTNLYYNIDAGNWPAGGNVLTFRANAPKECKVRVKINQGAQHDEWEFFASKEITIGTNWKTYSFTLKDLSNLIWGHLDPPSDGIVTDTVFGIGFMEADFPVEFRVDQIQIERSTSVAAQ